MTRTPPSRERTVARHWPLGLTARQARWGDAYVLEEARRGRFCPRFHSNLALDLLARRWQTVSDEFIYAHMPGRCKWRVLI